MKITSFVALLLVLFAAQSSAWWVQQCCKCPNDNRFDDIINITGGSDLGDEVVENEKREDIAPQGDKAELLELHNKYRRMVARGEVRGQPASSKIGDLVRNSLIW